MPQTLSKALLTLVAWAAATVGTGALLRQEPARVDQIFASLTGGVAWNVVAGLAVLAVASRSLGWRDLGFSAPDGRSVARLAWFPLLMLAPYYAMGLSGGPPPGRVILILIVNTALVALSEEWMLRGVVFGALRGRMRLWSAAALSSVLFGAIHVLNAFALGDLRLAVAQSVAAAMNGFLLIALMLRTGSIWTAVLYHMVWNLGLLLAAHQTMKAPLPEGPLPAVAYLVPLLMVLPNFIFGLFLLRKLPRPPVPSA